MTLAVPFDANIDRRHTGSFKWSLYPEDVLPAWVADMDFQAPEPVLRALREAVDHGIFGYHFDSPPLRDVLVHRMAERYGWAVEPNHIIFVPNLVSTLNFTCLAYAEPGDEVLMTTPVYPPFLNAPTNGGRITRTVDLAVRMEAGGRMHYEIDFDALEAAITPRSRIFLLCSPHNPVGRSWTRPELERLAEFCLRHKLLIGADEIHCDVLLDGQSHIPIAALGPEVAAQTLTMMAPSKTFNMPGLGLGFVIATNPEVRQRFEKATAFYMSHPGPLSFAGALAAYSPESQPWLDALLVYLRENRDSLTAAVHGLFPRVRCTVPEGTFVAWLDWRDVPLPAASPYQILLEQARVAFNDGAAFGEAGRGFVRVNKGTSRGNLLEIIERMSRAVEAAGVST